MKKNFFSLLTVLTTVAVTGSVYAQTYTNQEASVTWALSNSENIDAVVKSPDDAFSLTVVNTGDLEVTGTGTSNETPGVVFTKFRPSGSTQVVKWSLKPTTGLTFTPTKIKGYIARFGTDAKNGVKFYAQQGENDDANKVLLATYTAPRANKDYAYDVTKFGESSITDWATGGVVEITLTADQQAKFATTDFLTISASVGVGSSKEGGFAQICIEGTLSGTQVNLPRYTLTTAASPAEGGSMSLSPVAATYEQGTTVNVTVNKKFGYKFLNVTDDKDSVVSATTKFSYCIERDVTLTANFEALPYADKQLYDFIVPDDGTLRDAIDAANADNTGKRYMILVRKGTHVTPDDPSVTLDCTAKNGKTYPGVSVYLRRSNVSIVGEDRDQCILTNNITTDTYVGDYGAACPYEGLHNSMVLCVNSNTKDTYLQDVTFKSSMGDKLGRNSAYEDYGDRTVAKNIGLWGFQDTYYSGGGRYYFEGGLLRGATDYLCGKGDCFFNGCILQVCSTGAKIAVPSSYKTYGYIFRDCIINAEKSGIDGNFTLGRPWGSGTPTALFINTRMNAKPSTIGWDEMSGGYPRQFAEYNSFDKNGAAIDLSGRKTTFGDTHTNVPVLTKEEADLYTVEYVLKGSDNWDPVSIAQQEPTPSDVLMTDNVLTWSDDPYAKGWAIVLDGDIAAFTTSPTYTMVLSGTYAVRAINQMGGLSDVSTSVTYTSANGITQLKEDTAPRAAVRYNLYGQPVNDDYKGISIRNGHKEIIINF